MSHPQVRIGQQRETRMRTEPIVDGIPVKEGDVLWLKWPITSSVVGKIRIHQIGYHGWSMIGSPCQYPYTNLSWNKPSHL